MNLKGSEGIHRDPCDGTILTIDWKGGELCFVQHSGMNNIKICFLTRTEAR